MSLVEGGCDFAIYRIDLNSDYFVCLVPAMDLHFVYTALYFFEGGK